MLPIKKILCPTDFSEPALEALKVASELAQQFLATLLVVNIVPPIPLPYSSIAGISLEAPGLPSTCDLDTYKLELTEAAQEGLKKLVDEHIPKALSVEIMVSTGEPDLEIVRIAQQENADLIVLAILGQKGWKRFLIGSVAEKVVRLVICPVLVIHGPREE